MTKKTIGQIAFDANTNLGNMTHFDKVKAADWCSELDHLIVKRDCGEEYAKMRSMWLNMGAFRAFEWLDKNGWEVKKK